MAARRAPLLQGALFLLALCSVATGSAGSPLAGGLQGLVITENVAALSPHDGAKQLVFPHSDDQPVSKSYAQCFRMALQPERWSWKEFIWGIVEAAVSVDWLKHAGPQKNYASPSRGPEPGMLKAADDAGPGSLRDEFAWSSAAHQSAFFVALVRLSDCTPGKAVNATVICEGDRGNPCSISWSHRSCICIGSLPSKPHNMADISGSPKPPTLAPKPSDSTTISPPNEASIPVPESQAIGAASKPLVLQLKASVRIPKLSMLLTAGGLLMLSSAEPLSRLSAMHVLLGGMLGAGLAHVGVMLAIAAVPGAVVALPWVAALSAYRLGICEAIAMLVAGYVYTVAMALALLYLYTQHFSYVQAVYFFVVFHAALAGALRAETSRGSAGGALAANSSVAAVLVQAQHQSWVAAWVPGRAAALQRTVYFALLACGGALFAGTTNVWLHAAIVRAHSSQDLPLWLALAVAAAPIFVLVGLEIHANLLSTGLRAALTLPRWVLDEGADVVRFVRTKLGYYVPGEARGGGGRYHLRPVRRVFYTHALKEQELGVKWGPERDLWLLKRALRRVGYWLAGVKPAVGVFGVNQPGRWPGQAVPGGLSGDGDTLTGDHWSDPTWSASINGCTTTCASGFATIDEGDEACSQLHELPRGSAGTIRSGDEHSAGGRGLRYRGSDPEGALESCTYGVRADRDCHRSIGEQQGVSEATNFSGPDGRSGRRCTDRGEGLERGAPSGGGTRCSEDTCRDDREFDENVSEESESGENHGNDEWDWLAAEDLTPGEALAAQSCPVCLSLRKNLAYGCGHQTCHSCGAGLAKCPICRKRITIRVQLYH